jgi:GcrA cell cycle regulator
MIYMAWTEDRVDKLKALWKKGLSASQIAEELGENITRNAVIGKAHRLGLSSRPSPVKKPAQAKRKSVAPKKATPAAAAAAPVAPERMDKSGKISILDLTDRVCKWPLGHPGDEDFQFCGSKSVPGQPYCTFHGAMAYQAPQPRKDRRRNR